MVDLSNAKHDLTDSVRLACNGTASDYKLPADNVMAYVGSRHKPETIRVKEIAIANLPNRVSTESRVLG